MFPLDKPAQSQAASNGEQVFLIGSMVTWCNVDRTTFLFCSSSTAMPQHKYWNTKKQQLNFRMLEYIYICNIYIYIFSLFCFYHLSSHFRHIFVRFSPYLLGEIFHGSCLLLDLLGQGNHSHQPGRHQAMSPAVDWDKNPDMCIVCKSISI